MPLLKCLFRTPVLILAVVASAASVASAQTMNSNTATVSMTATLAESVTVSATPAGGITFPLVAGGTATATAPVVITTTWVLGSSNVSVTLVGYFTTAASALSGGSPVVNIPSSEVYGQMTTGTPTTYTAFTQSAALGTASAGLTLFSQSISNTNRSANRQDNLNMQINLSGQAQLPAGTYTGTLNLQAQAL